MTALPLAAALAALPALAVGCAQGGERKTPQSQVKVSVSHHMFGFKGSTDFAPAFPIAPDGIDVDRGTMMFADDSTYRVRRGNDTSAPLQYDLTEVGAMSLIVQGATSRTPSVRFRGGYGLEGDTRILFFADDTEPKAGLYWCTPVVDAKPDLAGDWHAFSLHAIFSSSQVLDPKNVGRALGGSLTIAADGKVTGSGKDSSNADITLSGTTQAFDDGRVNLALDWKEGAAVDARAFLAGAGKNLVLGLDEDETDGEAGLLALVRKRTGRGDPTFLRGDYLVGLATIFVNPSRSGMDGAIGTLSFSDGGAFRIEAIGSKGTSAPASYSGSYTLDDDGKLSLSVSGTKETWLGAVDQDYKTVILVDHFVENRQNSLPELNLFIAVRQKK